jgi:hypothetical protein
LRSITCASWGTVTTWATSVSPQDWWIACSLSGFRKIQLEHLDIDDIIQKLGAHAEQTLEDWVFDQCAEVATSLLSLAPEAARALLVHIAELQAVHIAELQAMAKLNAVMDWFNAQGLTTIGGVGVDNRGDFAFGPYPGMNEAQKLKAVELAEAWALNPFGEMARVKAILDYVKDRSQNASPEHVEALHLRYEEMKARLAASPVPAVKDRAKLL